MRKLAFLCDTDAEIIKIETSMEIHLNNKFNINISEEMSGEMDILASSIKQTIYKDLKYDKQLSLY